MPKAGSSSVQAWLRESAGRLRRRHGTHVLMWGARDNAPAPRLCRYRSGRWINSGDVVGLHLRAPDGTVLDEFFTAVEGEAARRPAVVLTSEAFALLMSGPDHAFLTRLEDLARRHEVSVAYYVRPQHSALEAAWRQWGFRSGRSPSEYLRSRAERLDYHETYRAVRSLAPGVDFEPRPFRRDILPPGGVVQDFARRYLGIEDASLGDEEVHANPGLPLEVVNALRASSLAAPSAPAWDNRRLDEVKRLVERCELVERPETHRSRTILQAYSHARFEEGNRMLAEALGWGITEFVPSVDPGAVPEPAELEQLDELWRDPPLDVEARLLWAAVDERLTSGSPTPVDRGVASAVLERGRRRVRHAGGGLRRRARRRLATLRTPPAR